jgi:BirA family biotin operon repressor/biotin-[acetyl-CoA-carboxylase] ligase
MLMKMDLKRSAASVPWLKILETATSTNDVISALARSENARHLSTVVTLNQTAGRGRLGRVWVAPQGKTLAISVLVRPVLASGEPLGVDRFSWFPLLAGTAMSISIDALIGGGRTGFKWPNDVQVDGLKVCGILTELLSGVNGVVIGAGVNLTLSEDELPVLSATSLAIAGTTFRGDELVDLLLSGYLAALIELLDRVIGSDGDAVAAGVNRTVVEWCRTLGREVRATRPGAADLVGIASGIDPTGRLLVVPNGERQTVAVTAGDVTHLRYE